MVVTGKAATLTEGMTLAAEAIDNRKARETLATLVSITSDQENLREFWSRDEQA